MLKEQNKLFNNITSLFFTHWLFCHRAKLKIKVFSRRRSANLLKLLYYKVTIDLCSISSFEDLYDKSYKWINELSMTYMWHLLNTKKKHGHFINKNDNLN